MKLSPALLVSDLRTKYSLTAPSPLSERPHLGRPLFYREESELINNHIYVLSSFSEYQKLRRGVSSCFFICPLTVGETERETVEEAVSSSVNLCVIDTPDSSAFVFNYLQEIFDKYDLWEETLMHISLSGGSIQSLLDASYPVLGSPLRLMGMDFSIIASSPGAEDNSGGLPTYEQPEYIEYVTALKQDTLYNAVREKDGAFIYPGYITGHRTLNVNIKRFSKTTHRLVMAEMDVPFSSSAGALLEFLATFIEHALMRNAAHRSPNDKTMHSIFLSILSDRTADYLVISRRLTSLGWLTNHEYLCIVLQTTYLDQQNLTINAICNYLENLFPYSCAFPFEEDVVVYFNLTKSECDVDDISDKIIYFIRDSFLKAGYSRAMTGHLNLRRQYIQSRSALEVGNQIHPYLWIHHFNKIALPYIYQQATKKLPGSMICHEKLLVLKKSDEEQNTEYVKTLSVYLDHHLNAVQSAKTLFIHRSTFLYRLEKIKDVLESDLEDPEELLYLMLSLRLMDQDAEQDTSNVQS